MPKISVIMPIYNTKEEYLREAIESILNQTFADWELIAIDNGSDDYIKNIIKSYTDNRIKYQRIEANLGPANARNLGIKQAQGKYIAFLDSDDISLPNRLEVQYEFLENNIDIGCVGTKVDVINTSSKCKEYKFPSPTKHKDIENHLILRGCVFCQSSVVLRKEILVKNNILYNNEYVPAEDYALWLTTAVDRHKAGRTRKKNGFLRETLQKLVGKQIHRKRNIFYSAFWFLEGNNTDVQLESHHWTCLLSHWTIRQCGNKILHIRSSLGCSLSIA